MPNIQFEQAMHLSRKERRAIAKQNHTHRIPGVQKPIVGKQKDNGETPKK